MWTVLIRVGLCLAVCQSVSSRSDVRPRYQMINGMFTYQEAQNECKRRGGKLAIIRNEADQDLVNQETRVDKHQGCYGSDHVRCPAYIGLKRGPNRSKVFQWVDGCSSFMNFGDYVSDKTVTEDCVMVKGMNGKWKDVSCYKRISALCEIRLPGQITKRFEIIPGRLTYNEAKKVCVDMGGKIAVIRDKWDQNLVRKATTSHATSSGCYKRGSGCPAYIGYRRYSPSEVFSWDGGCSTFTNWYHGQPDNYRLNENCVAVWQDLAKWNDVPCDRRINVVCEFSDSNIPSPNTPGGRPENLNPTLRLKGNTHEEIKLGGSLYRICYVHPNINGPWDIRWIIPQGARMIGYNKKSELFINGLKETDAGVYHCKAQNQRGSTITLTMPIKFRDPDLILEGNMRNSIKLGDYINERCYMSKNVNGPWTTMWIHPDGTQTQGEHLIIQGVRRVDQGKYMCKATNPYGVEKRAEVSIKFGDPSRLPKLKIADGGNKDIRLGGSLYRRCYMEPYSPKWTIRWILPNGQTSDANLYINNMQKSHMGQYTCKATNPDGSEITIKMRVGYRNPSPSRESIEIKITAMPDNDIQSLGKLHLKCFVTDPTGGHWNYRWEKYGRTLSRQNILLIPQLGPENSGTYKCLASNGVMGLSAEYRFQLRG